MPGFIDFARNQHTNLPIAEAPKTIKSETYIVTGANTGLGLECVKHIVSKGAGRVILAVRSRSKGEAARTAIAEATGRDVCEVWELDYASFDSIEAFAKRLDTLERLDVLILNAGLAMSNYILIDGIEQTFMVNVVSTMLLAVRALPKLQASAKEFNTQPRLVFVSSNAAIDNKVHKAMVKAIEDADIFDYFGNKKNFTPFTTYPGSKLVQMYAARHLASLVPFSSSGVIINTTSPGLCYTALDRDAPAIGKLMMGTMRLFFARTAEMGSRTLLQAAFAGPESHGKYCSECQIKESILPDWIAGAEGKALQKRVWQDLVKKLESKGHGISVAGTE